MIRVYHGDDLVSSRRALPPGVHYDAKNLTPEKLEQILGAKELFADPSPIIIEGFLPLAPTEKNLYLWLPKKLSPAQLKSLPQAEVREFKLSRALWRFLKTKTLADLHAALKTDPLELIWYLLHRQTARQKDFYRLKQMFAIELAVKTGQTDVPLLTQLELLLLSI